MKILLNYIQGAFANLLQNRVYAVFYILVTAFTFLFISILLHLAILIAGNKEPYNYAKRIVTIPQAYGFLKTEGRYAGKISLGDTPSLLDDIGVCDNYSLNNIQTIDVTINNRYKLSSVNFVDSNHWAIYSYNFIHGRPFTPTECEDRANPVAVITQKTAIDYFKKEDPIGEKLSFQGNEYRIIGVVENYASLPNEAAANIWVPYIFNKFIPSPTDYSIDILLNEDCPLPEAKERIARSLILYFQKQNLTIDIRPSSFFSFYENRLKTYGDRFFVYGVGTIIFLLILIPAVNIVTLNAANTSNKTQEIAIRRALGATKWSSFLQLIMENFILVFIGAVIGVILTSPVISIIEKAISKYTFTGEVVLISDLDILLVVLVVFPLAIIFTLLSGGIPAFIIAGKNISKTLKGESE